MEKKEKALPPEFTPDLFDTVEPIKVFDDMYYVGNKIVGVHILKTSEGLVLIEAMDRSGICEDVLLPGLKKLGLEKEPILALLVTHGHFDHMGGAAAIQNAVGCKVGMSWEDTAYMVSCDENSGDNRCEIPRIDLILEHDKDYAFGDKTIHVMFAPGHTPGCLNFIFDVHDHGVKHRVAMLGSSGVFGPGKYLDDKPYPYSVQFAVDNAFLFTASCVKFWEYCKKTECDIYMNPHPHLCDFFRYVESDRHRRDGEKSAFVIGLDGIREKILEKYRQALNAVDTFSDLTVKKD